MARLTKAQLIQAMIKIEDEYSGDEEVIHARHDDLLLAYINDSTVTEIFHRTTKHCA